VTSTLPFGRLVAVWNIRPAIMLPVLVKLPAWVVNDAVLDVMPPLLALMLVVPAVSTVANPIPLTVATAVLLDVQVSAPIVAAVPSVNVPPLAENCCVVPRYALADDGVMESDASAGAVTVKVVLAVTPFSDAVMIELPCAKLVAIPLAFSVVTTMLLEVQITAPEILPVVPSEYEPVAVNVTGLPFGVEGARGLMLIAVNTAAVTDRLAAGEAIPFANAKTVVVPTATPVATPVVLLIVATAVLPDIHIT
jgi:hypothetical protein